MMYLNRILNISLLLTFVTLAASTWAQPVRIEHRDRLGDSIILRDIAEKPEFVKRPKPRITEITGGVQAATDGFGIVITAGRAFGFQEYGYGNEEKYYHTHFLQLELSERLHRKEFKDITYASLIGTVLLQNENAYIYGKTNKFYNARLSYGQRRLFGGRGEPNSPLIQFFGAAGVSAALVKPYYLTQADGVYIKYDSTTHNSFLDKGLIVGKAPFSEGFDELEVKMGLHLKAGLHFDFAKNPKRVSAFEIGVFMDYYFDDISQMAEIEPKSFYTNLFLSYHFGKRW